MAFEFGISSAHRLYTANVQGQRSKVKVTAESNVSAAKTL